MFRTITILTLLSISAPAIAQPADLLRRAYELRRDGHDEAALPLLEQAYAASHTPSVAAQLGLCDEAVGRWEAAEQRLHEALAVPNDPWVMRHLESLEGAYSLALAHFPRDSSAVPMGAASLAPAPVAYAPATHGPAGSIGNNSAAPMATMPVTAPVPTLAHNSRAATLGYVGIAAGGVLIVGGIFAWIARELIVDGFNVRGCRVGDPMPAVGCDSTQAIAGRNTTTALAGVGLVGGGLLGIVGAAMLVLGRREESFPRVRMVAGPGDIGAGVVVRF